MSERKHLNAQSLYDTLRGYCHRHPDLQGTQASRQGRTFTITDTLMSGLALFSLKFSSLLQFDKSSNETIIRHNLKNLFGVAVAPSDTYMREILDRLDPQALGGAFKELFHLVQRGKVLERFKFLDQYYLLSVDGTGYFSSHEVHCDSCCKKNHRDGTVTYYHQILGAVLVHPDEPVVLPFAPEPIVQQDGVRKNDCERNAAKRLLPRIRQDHPHLPLIVVEDGLASNAPHIEVLKSQNMRFILGAKEKDHKWLFDWVRNSDEVEEVSYTKGKRRGILRFLNDAPLNDSRSDVRVNFLECVETTEKGKEIRFTWVTDLKITRKNAQQLMKGGRARWKIENETFNTLKNHGYQFEHNFGHGKQNLSTIFVNLMLLAFYVDQIQQTASKAFKRAMSYVRGNKSTLWNKLKSAVMWLCLESWEQAFGLIAQEIKTDATMMLVDSP